MHFEKQNIILKLFKFNNIIKDLKESIKPVFLGSSMPKICKYVS